MGPYEPNIDKHQAEYILSNHEELCKLIRIADSNAAASASKKALELYQ